MTEQQQAACADLARKMGIPESEWPFKCLAEHHLNDEDAWCYDCCETITKRVPPNPYESADASRQLVAWLASDDDYWRKFTYELFGKAEIKGWDYVRAGMTADLPIIARAACKALGIEVE